MKPLERYELVDDDGRFVILKDRGKSGYEPPVCYDRKTGKWSDMTEVFDLGGPHEIIEEK